MDVQRKCDAWYAYAMYMLRAGFSKEDILIYKSFLNLWRKEFSWVRTKQGKTIESKCDTCEDIEVS